MLKEYRQQHNLTQEQMAKLLKISVSYYALLESGARQISARVAEAMKQIGINVCIKEQVSVNSIIKDVSKIKHDQEKMKMLREFIDSLIDTKK